MVGAKLRNSPGRRVQKCLLAKKYCCMLRGTAYLIWEKLSEALKPWVCLAKYNLYNLVKS